MLYSDSHLVVLHSAWAAYHLYRLKAHAPITWLSSLSAFIDMTDSCVDDTGFNTMRLKFSSYLQPELKVENVTQNLGGVDSF